MGSLVQGKELAQIWRRERGGIRPLPSVGAKDAESGGKERQIRRPFHFMYSCSVDRERVMPRSALEPWQSSLGQAHSKL